MKGCKFSDDGVTMISGAGRFITQWAMKSDSVVLSNPLIYDSWGMLIFKESEVS